MELNLESELALKTNEANKVLMALLKLPQVSGKTKLHERIAQEIRFLTQAKERNEIKKEYLQCSNLKHYSAVVNVLYVTKGCVGVLKPKLSKDSDKKLVVDIICDGGLTWIKVVARNPIALSVIASGNSNYGCRNILDQAQEYLEIAKNNPCFFQIPKVNFWFTAGVEDELAATLTEMGIIVRQEIFSNVWEKKNFDVFVDTQLTENSIGRVNLDVSTMIAYTSSITNGVLKRFKEVKFASAHLTEVAKLEMKSPVKPVLDAFFQGKQLFCCDTAYKSFLFIIKTIGGSREKENAENFLKRISVLADDASFESLGFLEDNNTHDTKVTKTLEPKGNIKTRALTIFMFGDRIKAVTATANVSFVRAASQNGVDFVVFVHEARALTESKEIYPSIE